MRGSAALYCGDKPSRRYISTQSSDEEELRVLSNP